MSYWTHVAGLIRYDDTLRDTHQAKIAIDAIEEMFKNAPHGSEADMEYTIIKTHKYEKKGNVTSYGSGLCDVAFGGDFRDFRSEQMKGYDSDGQWQELRDWFAKVTAEDLEVRQGVMQMVEHSWEQDEPHTEVMEAK